MIGNPPYVKVQNIEKQQISYFKSKFESASGKYDLYVLFIENALKNLINKDGQIVFINPHRFMIAEYGKNLREYLIKERSIKRILVFGVNQFLMKQRLIPVYFSFPKIQRTLAIVN